MSELVFDKYEIIRRLAVGGMGEIFLARQHGVPGFDRLVVLKNLLPELVAQDGSVDLFLDEARVAATLNHPNIVAIFEVGKWRGVYFIAMEYIHGVSLAALLDAAISTDVRISPQIAAHLVRDAAFALDHAHTAKDTAGQPLAIVHRDISPQNIMVRTDGVTKVVDFGIAKAANRSTRTATGLIKGKVGYMAPEQITESPLDGRTDQFALGVVLWELLAGRRLFGGDNALGVIRRITQEPVPTLASIGVEVPDILDTIVMRMLARKADERFPRCSEVGERLRLFAESTHTGAADVAGLVKQLVGSQLEKVTRDLTPSGDNFVIDLAKSDTVRVPTPVTRRLRSRAWRPPAALLAVVTGVLAWAALRPVPAPPASPAAAVAPPPPKVEAPAPPVDAESEESAPRSKRGKRDTKTKKRESVAPGYLTVRTEPWSVVYAGDLLLGETTLAKRELPAGSYDLRFVNDAEGVNVRHKVIIKSGETTKLDLKLKP